MAFSSLLPPWSLKELKQRRRQRQRNLHLKITLHFLCTTSPLFQLVQILQKREPPRNQIGRSGVQDKKENGKIPRRVLTFLTKPWIWSIYVLFCRGRQRNMYQNWKRTCRPIAFAHQPFCSAALSSFNRYARAWRSEMPKFKVLRGTWAHDG